jgi:Ca2+-binding EF-hand superfamily protein
MDFVKEITYIFEHFDDDKTGFLDSSEIGKVFRYLKLDIKDSKEAIDKCVKDIDFDGNGEISPEEFITWFLTGRDGVLMGSLIERFLER